MISDTLHTYLNSYDYYMYLSLSFGNDAELKPPLFKQDGSRHVGDSIVDTYLASINEKIVDVFK